MEFLNSKIISPFPFIVFDVVGSLACRMWEKSLTHMCAYNVTCDGLVCDADHLFLYEIFLIVFIFVLYFVIITSIPASTLYSLYQSLSIQDEKEENIERKMKNTEINYDLIFISYLDVTKIFPSCSYIMLLCFYFVGHYNSVLIHT